jgi:peptidoglycan lytic transglycosylase B
LMSRPLSMTRLLLCGLLLLTSLPGIALDVDEPEVRAFIDEMVTEHDYDREALVAALSSAERKQNIIDAISKPAEKTLTWAEYRAIFITPERIEAGVRFWEENEEMLARIARDTGVAPEILIGIIGVETYFGKITGNYRVLDALSTLAFYYPPRAAFFRKELVQFFLLVREEEMAAADATGSYAGAMGRPQFMPSSYRAYAVDSTDDGKRDIWNNWTDVAGSIANYFNAHGWRSGDEVVAQASLGTQWKGDPPEPANVLTPQASVGSLSESGVVFATDLPADDDAALLAYAGADGAEYWVGFHNFFVITRYNRSAMYALAVYQLGCAVAEAREAASDADAS